MAWNKPQGDTLCSVHLFTSHCRSSHLTIAAITAKRDSICTHADEGKVDALRSYRQRLDPCAKGAINDTWILANMGWCSEPSSKVIAEIWRYTNDAQLAYTKRLFKVSPNTRHWTQTAIYTAKCEFLDGGFSLLYEWLLTWTHAHSFVLHIFRKTWIGSLSGSSARQNPSHSMWTLSDIS